MKALYKFFIPKLVEIEKTIENEDGSKTIRKVKEEVPQEFAIVRPGLSLVSDGELYYNEQYNIFLRAGIMSEMMLRKKYMDDDGVFAKVEHEEKVETLKKWLDNTTLLKELQEKEDYTEEDKLKIEALYKEDKELKNRINSYDRYEQSIFDNSAESLARQRSVFWWLLKLLYKVENGELFPFFDGKTDKEQFSAYEKINEEIQDETEDGLFYSKLIVRASFLVSLFYINGVVKPEEFAKLVEKHDQELG